MPLLIHVALEPLMLLPTKEVPDQTVRLETKLDTHVIRLITIFRLSVHAEVPALYGV